MLTDYNFFFKSLHCRLRHSGLLSAIHIIICTKLTELWVHWHKYYCLPSLGPFRYTFPPCCLGHSCVEFTLPVYWTFVPSTDSYSISKLNCTAKIRDTYKVWALALSFCSRYNLLLISFQAEPSLSKVFKHIASHLEITAFLYLPLSPKSSIACI